MKVHPKKEVNLILKSPPPRSGSQTAPPDYKYRNMEGEKKCTTSNLSRK